MAHELIHEVYEHAPADLTQAELNVLAVIAYHSLFDQRRCWMLAADMQRRTRQSASALRQAMQRLAGRGLECRVVQSIGKDGRPVYAHRGRATVYRLPDLAAPAGCACGRHANKGNSKNVEGDTKTSRKGASHTSPYGQEGDIPQPEGACETPPLQEKGDVSQPERQLSAVALNGRTGKKEGGTTDVTTGPHAREENRPPPSRRSRPRGEVPGQMPLAAAVRDEPVDDVDDGPADDRPADDVPFDSWCGRSDCRAPAACRPCGDAKARELRAAEIAAQQRDEAVRRAAWERARQRAEAAVDCPHRCVDGYVGLRYCDHVPRRPRQTMGGYQLVRSVGAASTARAAARRRGELAPLGRAHDPTSGPRGHRAAS